MYKLISLFVIAILLGSGCTAQNTKNIYNDITQIASLTNAYSIEQQPQEQKCDDGKLSCSITFDGMDTVWDFDANADCTIDISYQLDVTKGKAKFVLITADGNTKTIVEKTEKSKQSNVTAKKLKLPEGYNRIKLVAEENSQISFELQIEQGELHKIDF